MVGTAGSDGDLEALDRISDLGADLEQYQLPAAEAGLGQSGVFQYAAAQALHQHIGTGGQREPEFVGPVGLGGGAICKQVQLLHYDEVFHLTAVTIRLLMEEMSRMVWGRQGGDHEAGI